MSAGGMTRRSLLAASAGAVAGGMLRPRGALALLGRRRPTLAQRWLGIVTPAGSTVALEHPADLVGLEWRSPRHAGLWVRFRAPGGGWSAWVAAGANGHEPEAPTAAARQVGDPVWTGGGRRDPGPHQRAGERRAAAPGRRERGRGSTRERRVHARRAAALPLATPTLAAGPGQPAIIARRAWAQGISPPGAAPGYGTVRMAFVHHTENPNGYSPGQVPAMLRAIYVFHRYVKGWEDIGYNFVVDLFGRIFEARAGGIDEPVVGAQAGGYNTVSTGIAVLGRSWKCRSRVPRAAPCRHCWDGSWRCMACLRRDREGAGEPGRRLLQPLPRQRPLMLPRIAGHRDADSTDCPGNVLYGELPSIRASVRRLAPNPTRATLAVTPQAPVASTPTAAAGAPEAPMPPAGSGSPASGVPQTLSGVLELLDGTPLAGAPFSSRPGR